MTAKRIPSESTGNRYLHDGFIYWSSISSSFAKKCNCSLHRYLEKITNMGATTPNQHHKDDIESIHTLPGRQDSEKHPDSETEEEQQDVPYSSFTTWQKRLIVLAAATTALFSPMTAQIYFPALPAIAKDLNVTTSQINLTVCWIAGG